VNKFLAGLLGKIRFQLNSVEHNGQRVATRSEKQGAVIVHTPTQKYKAVNGTLSAWFEKNPQAREQVVPTKSSTRKVVQVQAEKKRVAVVAPPPAPSSPKPRHSKGIVETMIDTPETDAEFVEALHALAAQMREQAEMVSQFYENLVSLGISPEVLVPLELVAANLSEADDNAAQVVSRFMTQYEAIIELAADGNLPGGSQFFTGEIE